MIASISRSNAGPLSSTGHVISNGEWEVRFQFNREKEEARCISRLEEERILFLNNTPVFLSESGEFSNQANVNALLPTITKAENNLLGFEANLNANESSITVNSSHFSRHRMFFCVLKDSILFADDMRDLLPYVNPTLRNEASFSILKYGDVPEYVTIVNEVFSIPVGTYLKLSSSDLASVLATGSIDYSSFQHYFKLPFTMTGGDVDKTERLLENQYRWFAEQNLIIPISGGVDSTLMNHLIDRFRSDPYPGYYIQFGDTDTEQTFAAEAAKGTKVDLHFEVFQIEDTIRAFEFQNERLIQPIGESSTISSAYFCGKQGFKDYQIADGTLADGVYGSTNYGRNLMTGQPDRSQWQQVLNEQIAAVLKAHALPMNDRFHPRDAYMKDEFMKFMDQYLGPFGNAWIKNAKTYSEKALPQWQYLYDFLQSESPDDWQKYSLFKMVTYASKVTTAKTYDIATPDNIGVYPFMWKSIIRDGGSYTWQEKTENGIIKYPLKKILEKYMAKDFIYRKKVGMNSCFEDWIQHPDVSEYFIKVISTQGGLAEFFLGKSKIKFIAQQLRKQTLHHSIARMVIGLAISQAWITRNKISVG